MWGQGQIHALSNNRVLEVVSPITIKQEPESQDEELLFGFEMEPDNIREEDELLKKGQQNFDGIAILGVTTLYLDESIADIQRQAFLITVGIIIAGIVLTILMIQFVTNPIRKLVEATKSVGQGKLDHYVEIGRKDEIGVLAQSFNHMTLELKKSRGKIENWNRVLESRVIEWI